MRKQIFQEKNQKFVGIGFLKNANKCQIVVKTWGDLVRFAW